MTAEIIKFGIWLAKVFFSVEFPHLFSVVTTQNIGKTENPTQYYGNSVVLPPSLNITSSNNIIGRRRKNFHFTLKENGNEGFSMVSTTCATTVKIIPTMQVQKFKSLRLKIILKLVRDFFIFI